jgi:hypothetical protein
MGYRWQMSAEFHDWLAELRDRDPSAAMLAARAVAGLATEGGQLGPPLVTAVPDRLEPEELVLALERRYQDWLDSMAVSRHRVADAAAVRRKAERQLAELESAGEPASAAELAAARNRLAAAIEAQEQLFPGHQRQQLQADAFRTRMQVLKALYSAAQAELFIEQAQAEDDDRDAVAAATARLDEITGQIEQEVGWEAPAEGLMELRPGEPGEPDRDLRILFAVEPPGTALLIAVLEGPDAVRDHYREAILLASGVLRAARAGQVGEAAAYTYHDARSFLEEFFPGRSDRGGRLCGRMSVARLGPPLAGRMRKRRVAPRLRTGMTVWSSLLAGRSACHPAPPACTSSANAAPRQADLTGQVRQNAQVQPPGTPGVGPDKDPLGVQGAKCRGVRLLAVVHQTVLPYFYRMSGD